MKKSDLKDFMVVQLDIRNYERENEDMYLVIGNTLVSGDGYMNFRDYNENMECINRDKSLDNSIGTYSIIKVFEIKKLGAGIENFFNKDNLKLIWERQREIDWSKVPKWTKVQVIFPGEVIEWENYLFTDYLPNNDFKFYVAGFKDDEFTGYEATRHAVEHCRIHPSVKIPEEWYKEVR
ncbi:TPA: hypothetical protein I9Z35_000466 [Clostridium perfringens]|nr:hypothetical protein [Clostridium perfringens]